MKYLTCFAFVAIVPVAFALSGCDSAGNAPPASQSPAAGADHGEHDHGEHEHHDSSNHSDMEKMKAELAKLSPEDAAAAEKQHFCPVSGEMLGAMGPPQKVNVNDKQVWICCEHCKDQLLENPDKYLAKLKQD